MPELVDLTAPITEEMANHPAHGRSPLFLTGTRMNHDETADTWRGKGVFNMEQFDPDPFMDDLNRYGLPWTVKILSN